MTTSVPLALGGHRVGLLHDGTREPADHSPRPFVHPLLTPAGTAVSDDAPSDHPWHHGLCVAVSTVAVAGQVHPVNLWGGPTFLRGEGYVQLPNNGTQQVRSTEGAGERVRQQLVWRTADGAEILAEVRTWRVDAVLAGGVEWIRTTVRSRWTNTSGGDLAFGSPTTSGRPGAGYGGFFLRLAQTFDGATVLADPEQIRADGRASGRDGAAGPPPVPVAAAVEAVEVGEGEAMGSRGSWLGIRSAVASVLMVSGQDGRAGSVPWFVRTTATPMLCAAPFFHEEALLAPAATLDWTWSVLAADGAVPGSAFADAARAPSPESETAGPTGA